MTPPDDPILVIEGPEQSLFNPALPDGGLPPVVGVKNYCVFRATRDAPHLSDGLGYTYHHHVDLAVWRGRLYVAWNSCERDEDIWPSRELFATSADGRAWTSPRELFPAGVSTALRMYFYLSTDGRMLAIAGLRADRDKVDEQLKGGLVVREIGPDHQLGPVFTLQAPPAGAPAGAPARFDSSDDAGFVAACRALLADDIYLEQQDRGRLLPPHRRMPWHDGANWPGGKVPGDNEKWVAGKAYSFFRRPRVDDPGQDEWVGVSKMGWTTLSRDGGRTWRQPVVPPTLVTGKAKVWAARTRDGRYALVYNPTARQRWPLVVVAGDDGRRFAGMRVVHGELPVQRYTGADRSVGPQYVRGALSDDGSRDAIDRALWLVYSVNKEDIWVARVPLPVTPDETPRPAYGLSLAGGDANLERWNLYIPKWTAIDAIAAPTDPAARPALRLSDADPFDYAAATRVIADTSRAHVRFTATNDPAGARGVLQVDLLARFGSSLIAQLTFGEDGVISVDETGVATPVARWTPARPTRVSLDIDTAAGTLTVELAGDDATPARRTVPLSTPGVDLQRVTWRTGARRGVGGKQPVSTGSDRPFDPPAVWTIEAPEIISTSGR